MECKFCKGSMSLEGEDYCCDNCGATYRINNSTWTDPVINESTFCVFCDNLAEYVIENTRSPICAACKIVYASGKANPKACFKEI